MSETESHLERIDRLRVEKEDVQPATKGDIRLILESLARLNAKVEALMAGAVKPE